MIKLIVFLCLSTFADIFATLADESNPQTKPDQRSFFMGFNIWPWDATSEAVSWTYSQIQKDGDIIALHLEEGIPWNEMLKNSPFPRDFQKKLGEFRDRTAKSTKILLEVSPLNTARNGLSLYRSEQVNAPLEAPWSKMEFGDPDIEKAFLAYTKKLHDFFKPDFLLTGIEVNQLRSNRDSQVWTQYKNLQCKIYQELKKSGFKTPVGVSLITQAFYQPDVYATEHKLKDQIQALRDLEPCVDFIAWSNHPFVSGLLAEKFPDDYLSTIFKLTQKPQAVSESSYPAQVWSMPEGKPIWNGSPGKQESFLKQLLEKSNSNSLQFIIWFAPRDYDQLWSRPASEGGLGKSPLGLVWRDTGLFDETGKSRPAWKLWREWFLKSRK